MIDVPRFVAEVRAWEGVAARHQGRSRSGVDCAGLVLAGLAEQGVEVVAPANYHRTSMGRVLLATLASSPLLEPRDGAPQTGDLLVFRVWRETHHLAIALDADRMIHCTRDGVRTVTIGPLWRHRLVQCYGWR